LPKLTAMTSTATTPDQYMNELPEDRKAAMAQLRDTILKNLPKGFSEVMAYGMLGYVVPHSIYPAGYHCDPKQPLPFVNLASQKNNISLYHMGLYANPDLMKWFTEEYPKHSQAKLDIGKSCIRFKKPDQIPYALIGELMKKMSVEDWVKGYEGILKKG
jgi:uncharacterized protein YdhG (YjbR/CyaY superfamily)